MKLCYSFVFLWPVRQVWIWRQWQLIEQVKKVSNLVRIVEQVFELSNSTHFSLLPEVIFYPQTRVNTVTCINQHHIYATFVKLYAILCIITWVCNNNVANAATDLLRITRVWGHNENFWIIEEPVQFERSFWADTLPRVVQTGLAKLARDGDGVLGLHDAFGALSLGQVQFYSLWLY